LPLWFASGSGSVARQILGTVVISGMLAATMIAIFIIPALFVIIERGAKKKTPPNPPANRIADKLPSPQGGE